MKPSVWVWRIRGTPKVCAFSAVRPSWSEVSGKVQWKMLLRHWKHSDYVPCRKASRLYNVKVPRSPSVLLEVRNGRVVKKTKGGA